MKKYAGVVLFVLCAGCVYMAYRMGVSDCRTDNAEKHIENQQVVTKRNQQIQERVLGIDSDVNRQWLHDNWTRGN